MPQVSVVVPVFNTARYLDECLGSLLDQSLTDIQVICVDDGSTDGSLEILNNHALLDSRITVLSQTNQGPGAARNAAIAVATGTYLCFLDSDDMLDRHALETLHTRASHDGLDVLYFGAAPFCDDDTLTSHHDRFTAYYQRTADYPGVMTGRELMARMLDNGDYKPAICFQFMRAAFLREERIAFEEGILHEDNLFSFFCALAARRVAYMKETLYKRRVRADSIMTSDKSTAHFEGYFVSYLQMLRFVMRSDFDSATSQATGRLAAQMYQGAAKSLAALPGEVRETIAVSDESPEAVATLRMLERSALQLVRYDRSRAKLEKAQKKLKAAQRELKRIKASRLYRLVSHIRKVLRFGK